MSLTTFSLGTVANAGWKQNTNGWGATDIALATNDGIEIVSGTVKPGLGWVDNNALTGGPAIRYKREKQTEWVEGEFICHQRYNCFGNARIIASIHGEESTASAGGSGYDHVYTFNEAWSGQETATFGWTDRLVGHVVTACKPINITWTWGVDAVATMAVGIWGYRELTDDSGNNTLSSMNSNITISTAPAIDYLVLSNAQCTLRIAKAASAALGSAGDYQTTDLIYASNIVLTASRPHPVIYTTRNAPYPDEPIGSADWYGYSGTITIPVLEATALYESIKAGDECKMDLTFVGTAIGGGDFHQHKWEFPSVDFDATGLPDLNTPGLLELTLPFQTHTARSNPTGMAFSEPRFTLTDAVSGNHLANATS